MGVSRCGVLAAVLLSVALLTPACEEPEVRADGRYLYVAVAPKDRDGFRDLRPSIEVYAVDDGHRLVDVIPLPDGIFNIRGIAASAATSTLFLAHYGVYRGLPDRTVGGEVLAVDLDTEQVRWRASYPPAVDRLAVTPDGTRLYVPLGEDQPEQEWLVVDAADGTVVDRIDHISRTHNTIVTLDGSQVFLSGFGIPEPGQGSDADGHLDDEERSIAVADTGTNDVVRLVGPFREMVRPFTINGDGSLVMATVNDLIGFQVADTASGRVLHTAMPPLDFRQPPESRNGTVAHGIGMTADESEVWVVDQIHVGLHVFDVAGLPDVAPTWKKFVPTRTGPPQTFGMPGWIGSTIDGRYLYPESGEVIDTNADEVVGRLLGPGERLTHSRFMVEVDVAGGEVVAVGDQFGVGRAVQARAGRDHTALSGAGFTLDASTSTEPTGQPLTYRWVQTEGPAAVLRDPESAVTDVDGIDGPAELRFEVTASGPNGADTDSVLVTVLAPK